MIKKITYIVMALFLTVTLASCTTGGGSTQPSTNDNDVKVMQINQLIEKYQIKSVIFDFERTNFMDSSGIGMLMGRYKITNILGGKVIIYGIKKQVRRIIDMSGIDKIITICEHYEDALRLI